MSESLATRPASERLRPCVGMYETIHGAEMAVQHLVDAGFEPDDLVIVPTATRPLPGWRARLHRRSRPMAGIVVAAVVLTSSLAVLLDAAGWPLATALFAAATFAATAGALAAWADTVWASRVRRRAENERSLVAEQFEVHCRGDVERARHILARWWDPTAVPASSHWLDR